MEDNRNLVRQQSGIWRSLKHGDFEEDDVWSVLKDRADYGSGVSQTKESFSSSGSVSVPRLLPAAARMIPRPSSGNGSASSSNDAKVLQQSAPVNVPDWSKIYRIKPNKASKNFNHSVHDYDNDDVDVGGVNYGGDSDDEDDEEQDDEYDAKLPPHEFIARRLARSQISSFSVFEGVGRTLKGRDLSKVRNAVLTKTGFLESP